MAQKKGYRAVTEAVNRIESAYCYIEAGDGLAPPLDKELSRLRTLQMVLEQLDDPPERGRPKGSAKFDRTDHIIATVAGARDTDRPVKVVVRAVVQEIWDSTPAKDRLRVIGKTVTAATERVLRMIRNPRSPYEEDTYPIARRIRAGYKKSPN